MGFKASIIGGAGGMGRWFARHLSHLGYRIKISDVDTNRMKELANIFNYQHSKSNIDAVADADFVLISVPTTHMESVIDEISESIKEGAIVCEIASFKMQHFNQLESLNRKGVTTLSLHPMFGPSAERVEDLTFGLIPVKNPEEEEQIARSLFPEADIIVIDVETHDRVMSHVLSLTYLMNLAFSMTIGEKEVKLLKKLAGTSFTIQMGLAESIVFENSELVETILYSNIYTCETMSRFIQNVEKLKDRDILKNELVKLKNRFKENLDKKSVDNWRYESYLSYWKAMQPGGKTPVS